MMPEKTFIAIEFWQIVSFLLGFLGICFTFGKILLGQYKVMFDERFRHMDTVKTDIAELQRSHIALEKSLPLEYVRREDYIRGQTVLEAKMDSLNQTMQDFYKLSRGANNGD